MITPSGTRPPLITEPLNAASMMSTFAQAVAGVVDEEHVVATSPPEEALDRDVHRPRLLVEQGLDREPADLRIAEDLGERPHVGDRASNRREVCVGIAADAKQRTPIADRNRIAPPRALRDRVAA
jgi:hypothetical protein